MLCIVMCLYREREREMDSKRALIVYEFVCEFVFVQMGPTYVHTHSTASERKAQMWVTDIALTCVFDCVCMYTDVVKTNLQMATTSSVGRATPQSLTFLGTASTMYRAEGGKAFFRGMSSALMRCATYLFLLPQSLCVC